MSYEHGTQHYNLPQTQGSDTRDWFDTNEPFAEVDEDLWAARQGVEQATSDMETVKQDVLDLQDADAAMTLRIDGIDGRLGTAEQGISRLTGEIADVDTDLKDSICAIEEASATAAYQHLVGEFFWYNNTLYKTTQNIAIGQQIVPDTNCSTTNITTELIAGGQGDVEIDDTSTSISKVWSSSKVNSELGTKANSSNVYTKAEIDALIAGIGGGGMPVLNYGSPLHSFGTTLTYTANGDCWVVGSTNVDGANNFQNVKVNDVSVAIGSYTASSGLGGVYSSSEFFAVKVKSGDVVTVTVATQYIHVFAEA